jgi:DNA-binding NtrC family response regulator
VETHKAIVSSELSVAPVSPSRPDWPLLGESAVMREVSERIRAVGPARANILVTGEGGTGKNLVAGLIHKLSGRPVNALARVNCGAGPETLVEWKLLGHGGTAGLVQETVGGTLVLDDVDRLSPALQFRLMQAIADQDVRLVSTTRRDLNKAVESGDVREDFYYLISVVPVNLPPLRERRDDIPLITARFAERFAKENGRDVPSFTPDAVKKLCSGYWKGNVRELRNVIERVILLGCPASLTPDDIRFDDDCDERLAEVEQTFRHGSIRDMERLMILHRLAANSDNRTRTSRTLDISVRTLRNKLREYRNRKPDA